MRNAELAHFLNLYWHVEDGGPEHLSAFRSALDAVHDPRRAVRFKAQLAAALVRGAVSRGELEEWTLMDLDSDEDLRRELWVIWRGLYPGEEPQRYVDGD